MRSCEVLLVVIGPQWLSAVDEHGARRLDNELDYVRLEISVALTNRIPVMPLLVKGAGMPLARDLPPSISAIADMNAPPLADGMYWRDDVGRLITTIKSILPSLDPTPVRRGWRSGYRRGVLAAILLALLAAGASVGLGQGNESPADVDIGAIYPLTGIDASSGRDVYNGVRFAVQYVPTRAASRI